MFFANLKLSAIALLALAVALVETGSGATVEDEVLAAWERAQLAAMNVAARASRARRGGMMHLL